jgi:hypothetical protein
MITAIVNFKLPPDVTCGQADAIQAGALQVDTAA